MMRRRGAGRRTAAGWSHAPAVAAEQPAAVEVLAGCVSPEWSRVQYVVLKANALKSQGHTSASLRIIIAVAILKLDRLFPALFDLDDPSSPLPAARQSARESGPRHEKAQLLRLKGAKRRHNGAKREATGRPRRPKIDFFIKKCR